MRKVIYGGAMSFDGYIAREDGSVDWLVDSPKATELLMETWKRFDTIIMGRKTHEVALKLSPGATAQDTFGNIRLVVFSRNAEPGVNNGFEITNADATEFVTSIRSAEGKDIALMGGGEFAKSLFDAGLVDEVGFNVQPILLGRGVPAFASLADQHRLQMLEHRDLGASCIYLSYEVLR